MSQLQLIAIDETLIESLRAGRFDAEYSAHTGAHADVMQEVVTQMMSLMREKPRAAPWIGYLALDEATRNVIGTCGFKDAPDETGEIEIAYFTFPEFESQGYATAMASRLCDIAFEAREVSSVLAHTLPQPNASTRVLAKCGFDFVRKIYDDPEDGHIWRWRRER